MYNSMYNLSCGQMVKAVIKKWGNSYGVIIPADLVKEKGIEVNDEVEITIVKKITPVSKLFGVYKTGKSAQELKDEARKGWGE